MKSQIINIINSEKFIIFCFKLENGKRAKTYTGKNYRNYAMWSQFKVGDWVKGLKLKEEKKCLIDADSLVELL